MSKLKRFVVLFLSLFILVGTMSGCAELVSSETITVNAEISNTYHSGFYQTPMKIGNMTTYITHPESWATYIIYEEKEYVIGQKRYTISAKTEMEKQCRLHLSSKHMITALSYTI